MIPYSTCMRFNTRKRSVAERGQPSDKYCPSEWTLVQHFDHNTKIESAFINITSQDDQTLCFTWTIDSQPPFENIQDITSLGSIERRESDELDDKNIYLLLTLRRRKSLQQSIHSETLPLLDLSYFGVTERYLQQSYQWNFNTFSLDILTGGHSLSSLLLYLFKEYNFIETFQLDLINVLRCFYYLESGYHDTNPYHNSVHAADVTQAMHCFLQESKIKESLTPMEAMCSLLAAVSHDLDHPGVNQSFLVATKSHLAALYNNYSVLESHHWRFALSCFRESHIFDHLSDCQWQEIKYLLKHLIMATDISRQGEYIAQFQEYLKLGNEFLLTQNEHKYFVLQIALKCADLGNPCRQWNISKKWSEQICSEFYRQGDYERQLNLAVTSICDRKLTTISKIQTDFFKNIVRPLFELWDRYLDSSLTHQLMNNLNFNEYMWMSMERKSSDASLKRCNSLSSVFSAFSSDSSVRRAKSLLDISSIRLHLRQGVDEEFKNELVRLKERKDCPKKAKCVDGCGTPSITSQDDKSTPTKSEDADFDEEDDFIADRFNDDCGAILSTPALLLPSYYFDRSYYSYSRRGSAPDSIGIHKNELNTSKAAALLLLRNSIKANHMKRRSSCPSVKASKVKVSSNSSLQANITAATIKSNKSTRHRGRSLDLNNIKHLKVKNSRLWSKLQECYLHTQQSSLFDLTTSNYATYQMLLASKQRRRSVPQDIFIYSLTNYTA